MKLLILIASLHLFCTLLRLPGFLASMSALLCAPLIFQAIGAMYSELHPLTYYAIILWIPLVFAAIRLLLRNVLAPDSPKSADIIGSFIFCFVFALGLFLCHQWPDFISMGERVRDYALVAAVAKDGLGLWEPWMAGYKLNYYTYWYQFGHMLGVVLNIPAWEIYHHLVSFSIALVASSVFLIFANHLKFSLTSALFAAAFIAFGSNIQGIINAFDSTLHWWAPSRVIPGVIHEFPVWSFILGDAHPHYLNLGMVPFLIAATLSLHSSLRNKVDKGFLLLCSAAGTAFCIYAANAWELPCWLALVSITFAGILYHLVCTYPIPSFESDRAVYEVRLRSMAGRFLLLCFLSIIAYALFLSYVRITSQGYPIKAVVHPVERTYTADMLKHFGFPLLLILSSFAAASGALTLRMLAATGLCAALILPMAMPLLIITAALVCINALREVYLRSGASIRTPLPEVVLHSCGIAGVSLLIFCEMFFFDDPYGVENERMNTIFKFYSSIWFMLHSYAFFISSQLLSRFSSLPFFPALRACSQLAVLIPFTMFFWDTIPKRVTRAPKVFPHERGLTSLESEFQGASGAIMALDHQPDGVVLEAHGNPYSLTTHVATFSGRTAFLGWANHMGLLIRDYGEIRRRELVTDEIYTTADCNQKMRLMQENKISFVVIGPLEAAKYPGLKSESFSCLPEIYNQFRYTIRRTP